MVSKEREVVVVSKKQHSLQEVVPGLRKQHVLWRSFSFSEQSDEVALIALIVEKTWRAPMAGKALAPRMDRKIRGI